MTIVPDTKNWTWVLERPCPECGFDAAAVDAVRVGDAVRSNAAAWTALLTHPAATVRPSPDRWSALEYACHVRDVFRLFDERLALMLGVDDPAFANWDQDQTAIDDRYREQDPAVVLLELQHAGAQLAASFDAVPPGEWQRTGLRSDGARFTIDSFARYLLHDPVHHVWDVEQGYASMPPA